MLTSLDSVPWATLEHAYGPAVDVPDWLRGAASADEQVALEALDQLEAAVFHQGSWDTTTAKVVPFLVELVGASVRCTASIADLLARMSGGHEDDGYNGHDPWVFTSTPGPPTYPEAITTLDAIDAGRREFVGQLGTEDPHLRASVGYLLGGMRFNANTCAALQRALTTENETFVQASLALAVGKLGQVPTCNSSDPLVQGCVAVGAAWAQPNALGSERFAALVGLLTHHHEPSLPWVDGHPLRLAVGAFLTAAHQVADDSDRMHGDETGRR